MDKKKKEQLILLAVVVAFLAMLPSTLFKKRPQTEELQPPDEVMDSVFPDAAAGAPAAGQSSGAVVDAAQAAQPAPADADIPDPFDLPGVLQGRLVIGDDRLEEKTEAEEEAALPKIEISGIVWGTDSPTAFIGGGSYKVGDTVNDAKILAIDKKGVYFLYKDKKILMRMKKDKG